MRTCRLPKNMRCIYLFFNDNAVKIRSVVLNWWSKVTLNNSESTENIDMNFPNTNAPSCRMKLMINIAIYSVLLFLKYIQFENTIMNYILSEANRSPSNSFIRLVVYVLIHVKNHCIT